MNLFKLSQQSSETITILILHLPPISWPLKYKRTDSFKINSDYLRSFIDKAGQDYHNKSDTKSKIYPPSSRNTLNQKFLKDSENPLSHITSQIRFLVVSHKSYSQNQ